jgi:hypothetical protein
MLGMGHDGVDGLNERTDEGRKDDGERAEEGLIP